MNEREFDRMIRERIAKEQFTVHRRTEERLARSLKARRPLRGRAVLLIAAVLILTSAAALASLEGLGIVDFIGRGGERAETPGASAEENGATLRVTEALYAGQQLYLVAELTGEGLSAEQLYVSVTPPEGVSVVSEAADCRMLDGALYEFHSLTLEGTAGEAAFTVRACGMEITVALTHAPGAERFYLPADGLEGMSGVTVRSARLTSSEDAATLVVEYLDPAYRIPESGGPVVWLDGENTIHMGGSCPVLAERGAVSSGPLSDYWETADGVQYAPDGEIHLCRDCLPLPDGDMDEASAGPDYAIEALDGAGNPYAYAESSTVFLREEGGVAVLEATLALDPAEFGEEIQIRVYDIGTKERFGAVTLYAMPGE